MELEGMPQCFVVAASVQYGPLSQRQHADQHRQSTAVEHVHANLVSNRRFSRVMRSTVGPICSL